MTRILKQVVGIDVAQKELVVSVGRIGEDLITELFATKCFPNTAKGFGSLRDWVNKLMNPSVPLRIVMEATGVYHESLAYYLDDNGYSVSVVLPNKIANYMRTLPLKTITDKTASEAITQFGLERALDEWKRPQKTYKTLRQLYREQQQIVIECTVAKNHLHAELAEADCCEQSVERIKQRIAFLKKQEKQVKEQINARVKADQEVAKQVTLLCSIPGIGVMTATAVLAETNGFALIRNKKQLTSYAGLDVREKQSGTSVKGKARISKRGNKHLRKAMHMPALTAIQFDERFKAIFQRIVSKTGIKMKGVVAVQRKLLELCYSIYKTQQPYNKLYLQQQEKMPQEPAAS